MQIFILGSGSKGNSTLIKVANTTILIDVGFSYKSLCEKLKSIDVYPKDIDYVFITHDHSDHIAGLKVLLNKINAKVYIDKRIIDVYDYIIGNDNVEELLDENILEGNILVKSIPTSHDATASCGFLVEYKDESMVIITDTGYIHERNLSFIKNKNYYLIESNHNVEMLRNGRYPIKTQQRILSPQGHLSNEYSAMYMTKLIGSNTKKIILCHLSEENNTEEVAMSTYKEIFDSEDIKFSNISCAKQREVVEVTK